MRNAFVCDRKIVEWKLINVIFTINNIDALTRLLAKVTVAIIRLDGLL